jgi:DNA (cytosine-5)-methyltransferase 1
MTAEKGGWSSYEDAQFYNTLTVNDGPSATRQKHLVYQNGRLRGLTAVEWERLQGFPDNWTEAAPERDRYAALGDAMNVDLATWLGRRLVTVDARVPLLHTALTA